MNNTHRSNYIRNMGHCGARGSSQVHDLCSWLDMDLVYSSQDSCCQLGAERIPGSVFNLSLSLLTDSKKRVNPNFKSGYLTRDNSCRYHKFITKTDAEHDI